MALTGRLKKNEDFRLIYRKGKSVADQNFILYVRQNGLNETRFGFSVSKKTGNSVFRHRVTRLLRETIRLQKETFRSGRDVVVVARAGVRRDHARDLTFAEVERSFLTLAKRAHLINE